MKWRGGSRRYTLVVDIFDVCVQSNIRLDKILNVTAEVVFPVCSSCLVSFLSFRRGEYFLGLPLDLETTVATNVGVPRCDIEYNVVDMRRNRRICDSTDRSV